MLGKHSGLTFVRFAVLCSDALIWEVRGLSCASPAQLTVGICFHG